MLRLPTVLLEHEAPGGRHYDWLLADPSCPEGELWTARVQHSSQEWARVRQWFIEPIGRHRRIYLEYEGPLSRGRGTVAQVDAGWFHAVLWTPRRAILDLHMRHFQGRVLLGRQCADRWRCQVQDPHT